MHAHAHAHTTQQQAPLKQSQPISMVSCKLQKNPKLPIARRQCACTRVCACVTNPDNNTATSNNTSYQKKKKKDKKTVASSCKTRSYSRETTTFEPCTPNKTLNYNGKTKTNRSKGTHGNAHFWAKASKSDRDSGSGPNSASKIKAASGVVYASRMEVSATS